MNRLQMSKLNVVDRVISYFNPNAGVSRLKARTALSLTTGGYRGGKRSRRGMMNWLTGEGSADADTVPELPVLRSRSRDLRRNVPTATGAIATQITNVVGDGLRVRPGVNRRRLGLTREQAAEWNRLAKEEFELACRTADYTRVHKFGEMQALALGSKLESGDVFVLFRFRQDEGDAYGVKLQIIEADRCSNPNNHADTDTRVAGVETNKNGVVIAYHFSDGHPGDIRRKHLKWRRVPARYKDGRPIVIHLYDRLRPGQSRGVPYLAPVIEAIKQLGDYTDAEVTAAVVSAMFTVFVKNSGSNDDDQPLPHDGERADGEQKSDLAPGAILNLYGKEEIQTANPGRPNPVFDAFVKSFMQQIGVALELPFELLIKHFEASYSASRAALEMAWQSFRKTRAWLAGNLCQAYYEAVITEAIVRGRIEAPGFFDDPIIRAAWLQAEWIGPVKMSLDPKKDAEADKLDIENKTKTREQIVTERTGGNVEAKIEQLGHEQTLITAAGLPAQSTPITTENPDKDDDDNDDTD